MGERRGHNQPVAPAAELRQTTALTRKGIFQCDWALVQRGGRVALEVSSRYGLPMPFKHNASRRHHIPKQRFRVMNWPAYEAGLPRRGDLTFWVDDAALAGWQALRRATSGGQRLYSDLAIELVLTLRLVFHFDPTSGRGVQRQRASPARAATGGARSLDVVPPRP